MDKKQHFYKSLNERQKRHYVAQLAFDLGYGGIKELCEAFTIDLVTVRRGMRELETEDNLPPGRVRKAGGGRKKTTSDKQLTKVFTEVIEDHTAGKPQDDSVRWVGLKRKEIQEKLAKRDHQVSPYIVGELIKNAGLKKRSYLKALCGKEVAFRNQQFEKIAELKSAFIDNELPVLSIDVKHKEYLGNFYRDGTYYDFKHRKVNDHDFKSLAKGIVIPHGLYDIADNFGYLTLGTSKDTSQFCTDNIAYWWQQELQWKYPDANWLLLLCDGGGSNNSRRFK